MHKFDFRLVINEKKTTSCNDGDSHILQDLYVLHRQSSYALSDRTHAVQDSLILTSKGP